MTSVGSDFETVSRCFSHANNTRCERRSTSNSSDELSSLSVEETDSWSNFSLVFMSEIGTSCGSLLSDGLIPDSFVKSCFFSRAAIGISSESSLEAGPAIGESTEVSLTSMISFSTGIGIFLARG